MPDPDALHERLNAALTARRAKSTLRSLERPEDYDPSNLVDLSSNDYLSLARSSTLQSSLKSAIASHEGPLYGPASSRLLDGNTPLHISLEKELRDFFVGGTEEGKRTKGKGRGRDAGPEETKQALLFNSGFDANVGIFSCLPSAQDAIVFDELIHASCHDGMRHSRARTKLSFKHNAPKDLERVLLNLINQEIATTTSSSSSSSSHYKSGSSQVYVAVESLYSMDGDLAPLKEFLEITERLFPRGNCHLIVDEAHTTGLCGPQGRGLACALGVQDRVLVRLHTFGKAMSCGGGVIICSATLRNYFINYARPLIYSTVMSNTAALTVRCSLRYLREGQADEARLRLHDLARYTQDLLRRALQAIPYLHHYDQTLSDENGTNESLNTMASPIIPVLTRHPRPLSRYLIANGYLVRPIAHPTVPKGQERIRICLHSANTELEVESLVKLIVAWSHTEEAKQLSAQPLALAKL